MSLICGLAILATSCSAGADNTPPPPLETSRAPSGMVAFTIDGDGAGGDGFVSGPPKARLLEVGADGQVALDRKVEGSGTSQLVRAGGDVLFTGRQGVWSSKVESGPAAAAPLDKMQSHLFHVGDRNVALINAGFEKPGQYVFRAFVARQGSPAAAVDIPMMVDSVAQCGSDLIITGAQEAADHYRQPHVAYRFDPAAMTLTPLTRWTPADPTVGAYMSYAPCTGSRGVVSLQTHYAVDAKGENPVGTSMGTISTGGRRSEIRLKDAHGAALPGYLLGSRRTTGVLGNSLLWVGGTQDMKRNWLFRSDLTTGVTTTVCDLRVPGMDPRQQISAVDGEALVTIDYPNDGGDLRATVRRLSNGQVIWGPTAVQGVRADETGPTAPITAVVLDPELRAGRAVSAGTPAVPATS